MSSRSGRKRKMQTEALNSFLCFNHKTYRISRLHNKYSKGEYASTNADLPEDIIHSILSKLLPTDGTTTKQLGRLSLISKRWLSACSSYNVVDFIGTCSYGTPKDVEKTQLLITYLDKTITNYQASSNNSSSIHRFRLHIDFKILSDLRPKEKIRHESYSSALPPLLDKWINIALDKRVQHLDLRIRFRGIYLRLQERFGIARCEAISTNIDKIEWRYHIPIRALSVKSLKLGWQVCLPRSLTSSSGDDVAALPLSNCLRCVELFSVNKDIDNNVFERLIRACPAIEELIIDSQYIYEIKVSGLHRLKKISIRRYIANTYGEGVESLYIKIEAPSLETLCLLDIGRGRDEGKGYYTTNLDVVDCCNLKCLKLIRDLNLDDDKFDRLVSKFPMLESLELEDCSLIKETHIRNPVLKKIELKFGILWGPDFRRVKITSPNVLHLRYECTSGRWFPSIWVSEHNNRPRYMEAVFKNSKPIYLFPNWFRNLRESMVRVGSNLTSLSFSYTWTNELGEEKVLVPTQLPACKIDNLNLNVTGRRCSSFPVILNRLLSTFHPTTLQASIVADDIYGQGHAFLKFLCENLANQGNNNTTCSTCSIDNHYKCWKHQLKEVKFEGIKGGSYGKTSLNWEAMLNLLPTLAVDDHICFRLNWGPESPLE